MAADKSFIARWLRRKREAALRPLVPPVAASPDDKAAPDVPAPATLQEQMQPPLERPLPPIDLAQPGALQALLRTAAPAALTRAALRHAWRSDPAIRDFIGLSENSFDFTAPDLPGFGPLSAEQVQKLLARAFDSAAPAESSSPPVAEGEPVQSPPDAGAALADDRPAHPAGEGTYPAVQHEMSERLAPMLRPKRHGGALPE